MGRAKFFFYVYAWFFILITDNKPLSQILHSDKSLPVLCITRMANYADYLTIFNYKVEFRPTKLNANADYCSRAPLPLKNDYVNQLSFDYLEAKQNVNIERFDEFILNQIELLPIRAKNIAKETHEDLHLGKIV